VIALSNPDSLVRRGSYALGVTLVCCGVLIGLFIPYQIFYTNHLQQQNQQRMKLVVEASLPAPLAHLPIIRLPRGPITDLSTPSPSVIGDWIGLLEIPAISVSQAIVEGVDTNNLRLGPGHYPSSAVIGARGNVAIAGHRTTWGRPFRYLDQLRSNDAIIVTTTRGRFLYRVVNSLVVAPNDTAVLAASMSHELTLTTCNPPYSASSRLVVHARLVAEDLGDEATIRQGSITTRQNAQAALRDVSGRGGFFPIVLYGLLALMVAAYGRRWAGVSRSGFFVASITVVLTGVLIFEFFGALTWQLPAGF